MVISVYHPYLLYGMDYVQQIECQGDISISFLSIIWHGLRIVDRMLGRYQYIILIYYMAWITYNRQNVRAISVYHPYLLYGMEYVYQMEQQGDQYIILIYYMPWITYIRQNVRVISVYHPYLLCGMDYVQQIECQGDISISSLSITWHGLRIVDRMLG